MIEIGNTIISLDIIEIKFACNINACKGICCIEGDSGAPITKEEETQIKEITPKIIESLVVLEKKIGINDILREACYLSEGLGWSYLKLDIIKGMPKISVISNDQAYISDKLGEVVEYIFQKSHSLAGYQPDDDPAVSDL